MFIHIQIWSQQTHIKKLQIQFRVTAFVCCRQEVGDSLFNFPLD